MCSASTSRSTGGTEAARHAAVTWRDERLAEIEALRILQFAQIRRGNNTSGVPGVHFLTPARQPEGVWQARLKVDGNKTHYKSFSVLRYGERRAFELAVKARKQMLASATDRPFVHDALAVRAAERVATRTSRNDKPDVDRRPLSTGRVMRTRST